jgi:secreted Zn-dependent insulinase-like peptidase
MCKVITGKQISNKEDIRNLITVIVLRQSGMYNIDIIVSLVFKYLDGSQIQIEKANVLDLISDGLDVLKRNGDIKCWNGMYQTIEIN